MGGMLRFKVQMTRLLRFPVMAVMVYSAVSAHAQQIAYPPTERGIVVDQAFGQSVADPYRWLEADVRTDAKVRAWVDAQATTTQAYLATLPDRETIRARLTTLWNFERESAPVKQGGRYFYTHNSGLQNQAPLYVRDALEGAPRQLIDPNSWAKDGATALAEWFPSNDGTKLIYTVQDGGTDWRTIRLLDVATGSTLKDEIPWAKIADPVWKRDGSGFYYGRFAAPKPGKAYQDLNLNHRIFFHRLGTPVAQDREIFATPDHPDWIHTLAASENGRWLIVFSAHGILRYQVALIDLSGSDLKPRTLIAGLENDWQFAGSSGDILYFVTDRGAGRHRIVAFDVSQPQPAMREIVSEDRFPLQSASIAGGRLVALYLADAKSEARQFDLDGKPLGSIPLPGIGTITDFKGRARDSEAFFSFASFNHPDIVYRLDVPTARANPVFKAKLAFDPDDYVTEQRFYPAKDGTRIPIFLTYRKGLDLSHGASTLLYAYGGFAIPRTPEFRPEIFGWIDMGGVYAQASIRGGGEYGEAWHDAGRLERKQTVFDDFIAASEYLISAGITTRAKLAIRGGSNGGLLIGAVVNQRPDLFAVALPRVGVMDMLRFDRFTAGQYWVDEYGHPDRAADWKVLRAYSPYHNVRSGIDYPAIMAITADTDDRVVPGHSFKYVAALQNADIGPRPHLIRIETRAGHGAGKPTDKAIAEAADELSFAARWSGLTIQGARR
jgi:prolyl oligopeptidase